MERLFSLETYRTGLVQICYGFIHRESIISKYFDLDIRILIYVVILTWIVLCVMSPLITKLIRNKFILHNERTKLAHVELPHNHYARLSNIYLETEDNCQVGCILVEPKRLKSHHEIILLLHGNGCNRLEMLSMIDKRKLSDNFAVLIPDYRGFGDSTGEFSVHGVNLDIQACLRFLNSKYQKNVTVVGFSLGGAIALEYANFQSGFYKEPHSLGKNHKLLQSSASVNDFKQNIADIKTVNRGENSRTSDQNDTVKLDTHLEDRETDFQTEKVRATLSNLLKDSEKLLYATNARERGSTCDKKTEKVPDITYGPKHDVERHYLNSDKHKRLCGALVHTDIDFDPKNSPDNQSSSDISEVLLDTCETTETDGIRSDDAVIRYLAVNASKSGNSMNGYQLRQYDLQTADNLPILANEITEDTHLDESKHICETQVNCTLEEALKNIHKPSTKISTDPNTEQRYQDLSNGCLPKNKHLVKISKSQKTCHDLSLLSSSKNNSTLDYRSDITKKEENGTGTVCEPQKLREIIQPNPKDSFYANKFVIIGSFSSLIDICNDFWLFRIAKFMIPKLEKSLDIWNSKKNIISCRRGDLLIIHSAADELINMKHSVALSRTSNAPLFVIQDYGHVDTISAEETWKRVLSFIKNNQ